MLEPMIEPLSTKPTILVIEDERPLVAAIKMKMERSGLDVVTCGSVAQALGYLQEIKKVNAIWLDHYLLGKENGLDFVAKLKNDVRWESIPIFVVSNTAGPDKVQSYMQLGVKKYYVKAEYRLDQIISDILAFLHQEG